MTIQVSHHVIKIISYMLRARVIFADHDWLCLSTTNLIIWWADIKPIRAISYYTHPWMCKAYQIIRRYGQLGQLTGVGLKLESIHILGFATKLLSQSSCQANYCDTSTFGFGSSSFSNFTGTVRYAYGVSLNCSGAAPCQDLQFSNVDSTAAK